MIGSTLQWYESLEKFPVEIDQSPDTGGWENDIQTKE